MQIDPTAQRITNLDSSPIALRARNAAAMQVGRPRWSHSAWSLAWSGGRSWCDDTAPGLCIVTRPAVVCRSQWFGAWSCDLINPRGKIVAALEVAFAGVPRGSITLHEAEVIDSHGTSAERERARERDKENDWMDVTDASLDECRCALPHLDSKSQRFYLPSCMRYV